MSNLWRAALLAIVLPQSAWAGWASLGAMPQPQRDGQKLTWKSAQGVLSVSVISPEIVRVRFLPKADFGRDHSYAVVGTLPGDPNATFDVQAAQSIIRTSALEVIVKHDPLRVSFATAPSTPCSSARATSRYPSMSTARPSRRIASFAQCSP